MENRLRSLRRSRGWTQDDLADMLGISKGHISEMESGKKNPSLPLLTRIAEIFGVERGEVIGDSLADRLTSDEAEVLSLFRKIPSDQHDRVRWLLRLAAQEDQETDAVPPDPSV